MELSAAPAADYASRMGLTYAEVRQLLSMRDAGVRLDTVLTVGRQVLHLYRRDLRALAREFTVPSTLDRVPFGGWADDFLRDGLQVGRLDTMDASSYEGATLVHDLNTPVDDHLHERYDAVIDCGSLEHIFNVPVALANLMKMVTTGGRLLLSTPTNNLCGHGFYQFSAELAFRVFRPEHGFEAERVAIVEAVFPNVEATSNQVVFDVRDPEEVGKRVLLQSCRPAMLIVQARKARHLNEPFVVAPKQSDYARAWRQQPSCGLSTRRVPWMLPRARHLFLGVRERIWASKFNRRVYTPSR
jgi:hypothetical protein